MRTGAPSPAERRRAGLISGFIAVGASVALANVGFLLDIAPPCLWHEIGFRHCWGCGMSRALAALLQGDLKSAIQLNARSLIVAPLLSWAAMRAAEQWASAQLTVLRTTSVVGTG
jgi:hypothetical protein